MENYYESLLQYALRLIARKRYTEQELRKKLISKKIGSKKDQEKVIDRMKEFKYVDDKAFAKDYISTRTAISPRGKQMLKMELRKKGIKKSIVENVVESAKINEEQLAAEVIKKREKRFEGLDRNKKREKIMRLLVSRGFKVDTIYKVLDKC